MDTIRIGLVGAGGIVQQRHLPGLAKLPGVELVAVCNRSPESSQAVAADWGIRETCTDWRELVARDDLDAVLIGTWPYLHRDITAAALMAGKHVFCQARMTMNLADARHMYELSQLTDRVTALCPPPHVMGVDRLVRELLSNGFVGDVRHVRVAALAAGGADAASPASWRQQAVYSGLNAMTLGIWAEILLKWFGPVSELVAMHRTWVDQRPNKHGGTYQVTIPDSVRVLATFAGGAELEGWWSGLAHHGPGERIEIYGSRGTVVYQVGADHLLAARAGEPALQPLTPAAGQAGSWTVEENFIQAIRSGEPVQTSFLEGLRYMEFVEAVYRSHETGSVVRFPLLT